MSDTTNLLRQFNYQVNFELACEELKKNEIDFQHTFSDNKFQVFVKGSQHDKAQAILDSLELDDQLVESSDGPTLQEYSEWSDRQYEPSHYTGGKAPHWYADKKTLRIIAPLYLLSGLFSLIYFFDYLFDKKSRGINPEGFIFMLLYIFIGVAGTYRAYKK